MDRRKVLLVVAVLVAALGAGLVFLYAADAENRADDKVAKTEVLVASQTINPGESVSDAFNAGKVVQKFVETSDLCPAGTAPSSDDPCVVGWTNDGTVFGDKVALTTVYGGELLLTQKFGRLEDVEGASTVPIPEGQVAITLQLTDTGRVGSFTQPGAHVAIFLTQSTTEVDPVSGVQQQVLLPACVLEDDVLVLGVGSRSVSEVSGAIGPDGQPVETVATTLLTVAATQRQAQVLVAYQDADVATAGKLSFGLRTAESDIKKSLDCGSIRLDADGNPVANGNGNG